MQIVYTDQAMWAEWAASRIPHAGRGFGSMYVAIGIIDHDGRRAGAVVYHNYFDSYASIEISFVADNPKCLTKKIITEIMRYPFDQLHCGRVTAITPRKATSARRFLEKFGFKREGVARRGFGNDDAVLYGLLAREWRSSRLNLDRVALSHEGHPHTSPSPGPERSRRGANGVEPGDRSIPVSA